MAVDAAGSPASRPTAGAAACESVLRILVNIDITASMGPQLKAVKSAVSEFVTLCADLPVPLSFCIITFTECDKQGCFASLAEFAADDLPQAKRYVQSLQLSRPPEAPGVSANGADAPENTKAALHRMTDLDPGVPTVAFLITDAAPHMQAHGTGATAVHELQWLAARGVTENVAKDVCKVFNLLTEHFAGNLVMNCIVYNSAALELYGYFCQATGGMLMIPRVSSDAVMSRGMLDVVRALLSRMPGQPPLEGDARLEGFDLMDVTGLLPRTSEQDPSGALADGDKEAIFEIAMERMVAVTGGKWAKRAMGITAPEEQLKFVWATARYVAFQRLGLVGTGGEPSGPAQLQALLGLRRSIVGQMPETSAGHFSISEDDIARLEQEVSAAGSSSGPGEGDAGSKSVISWESVADALAGSDGGCEDWLAAVMGLLHGYPMRLALPLDKSGRPDFMDSWSAVVEELGCDRLSASDFMRLVGPGASAPGPTDRGQHNALLVTAEPADPLASLVLRIASGTQVLNYVCGVLMGAPPGGFLPNLYPGTAAACLMRILTTHGPMSAFQWSQARQIVHSLRCLHRSPSPALVRQLAGGTAANPADPISKLVAALTRLPTGAGAGGRPVADGAQAEALAPAVRLVLQEWMAALMQRHYGKSTPETDAAYMQSLSQALPLEAVCVGDGLAAGVDPLARLHVLELKGVGPEEVLVHDWRDVAMSRLSAHPVYVHFRRCAVALLALLRGDPEPPALLLRQEEEHEEESSMRDSGRAAGGDASSRDIGSWWPGWREGVLMALLLRQRTARYKYTGEEEATGGSNAGAGSSCWQPVDVGSVDEVALGRLREVHSRLLAGYRAARVAEATARLVAAAAEVLRTHWQDCDAASSALQQLYLPISTTAADSGAGAGGEGCAPTTEGDAAGVRGPGAALVGKGPTATLLDQSVQLNRTAVPLILERLEADGGASPGCWPAALRVLVTGGWTSTPPQALRRCQSVLQACAGQPELLDAIFAAQRCTRMKGFNRHGHSVDLQYPGPAGWTQEYEQARLAATPECERLGRGRVLAIKQAAYIAKMKRFTEVAARAEAVAADNGALLLEVTTLLTTFSDANKLPALVARLKEMLPEHTHLELAA